MNSPEPLPTRPAPDELEPITVPQRRELQWSYSALLVLAFVGVLPVLMFCLPDLFLLPVLVAIEFVIGGVSFVQCQLPEYLPTALQTAVGLAALLLLACGGQALARRVFGSAGGWRGRWTTTTLVGSGLFLAVGIAVSGIGANASALANVRLLSHDSWHAEAMRRSESRHHLKQIGLGAHNYLADHRRFPGGTFDELGRPMHSWATRLLPYLDEAPLYNQIRHKLPWTAPENRPFFQKPVQALTMPQPGNAPAITPEGYATSGYAGNVYVLGPGPGLAFREFTDGASNTILAGEVVSRPRAWGDPLNGRDPGLGINASPDGFGSHWRRDGCQFLLGDGSVRALSKNTDPAVLRKLATPHGGEKINAHELP